MSSLNIYSTKYFPYVYMGIHKSTKQFYIGVRFKSNIKNIPEIDITKYKTSSKRVKSIGFDNFDWSIIAMFHTETSKIDAMEFEQKLIKEHWGNPLLLNLAVQGNKYLKYNSKELGDIISKAKKGKPYSKHKNKRTPEQIENYRKSKLGMKFRLGMKNTEHQNKLIGEYNSQFVTCYDLIEHKFLNLPKDEFRRLKSTGRYVGAKSSKIPR